MDKNILDRAVDKLISTLTRVDDKAKNEAYYPYGKVKATAEEKRTQFDNLNVESLTKMVKEQGPDKVNKYLGKYMA